MTRLDRVLTYTATLTGPDGAVATVTFEVTVHALDDGFSGGAVSNDLWGLADRLAALKGAAEVDAIRHVRALLARQGQGQGCQGAS